MGPRGRGGYTIPTKRYDMGFEWDIPWDGIFLGPPIPYIQWDPIKMLFLEAILLAAAAESHVGATLEAILGAILLGPHSSHHSSHHRIGSQCGSQTSLRCSNITPKCGSQNGFQYDSQWDVPRIYHPMGYPIKIPYHISKDMGSKVVIPYHPMVWDHTPISHTIPYLSGHYKYYIPLK